MRTNSFNSHLQSCECW